MTTEVKEIMANIDSLALYLKPSWNQKGLAKALGMSVTTLKKQEWYTEIPYIPTRGHRMWFSEDVIKTLKEYRILD
ncbi:hypothetical protein [Catellicoccus marimammalium]|uniref:Uncharacterized protein n=1 Tax=Catellicoccus marimammalium M35/04/3 TaxID=1234409 RepID=K8ZME7_9ENTE|nr:hypothetical protein [Catellicoccus marimammalium]EKU27713.1 hypothetical protein C683_0494 [Catellicoccus marimammalium M35/04/3]